VQDGDKVKNIWLWTTLNTVNRPYDFDGFRVFIWNLRRHRYETALIQRHLQGYFPTTVDASAGTFAVCVSKDDGGRFRREYRLVESQVKFVGEKPCNPGGVAGEGNDGTAAQTDKQKPDEGTFDRLKGKLKSIIK